MLRVTLPVLPGVQWAFGERLEVVEDGHLLEHMSAQQCLAELWVLVPGVDDLEAVGYRERPEALFQEADELRITLWPERHGKARVELHCGKMRVMLDDAFLSQLVALLDSPRAVVRAVL